MVGFQLYAVRLGVNNHAKAKLTRCRQSPIETDSIGDRCANGTDWASEIDLLNEVRVGAIDPLDERTRCTGRKF